MRLLSLVCAAVLAAVTASAAPSQLGRVIKVLPHYLDQSGKHTIHPSLYARDAYQADLRKHPEKQSGLQFDVQWTAMTSRPLKLRIEMRGALDQKTTAAVVEQEAKYRGFFHKWAKVPFTGDEFKKFGQLSAWRATLWDGDQLLSEQKSFLW